MIENIYSGESMDSSQIGKANSKLKTPKNVRQIGKIGDNFKIYVEDYVKTYVRQLAEGDYTERCIAVLIGEYRMIDGIKDVFIYGAIGTNNAYSEGTIEFTEGIWTNIYELIKQYFPEGEIVGWYFGGTSFGSEETSRIKQAHIDNFAGKDKVLLTYDILEKEDNFYLYDNGFMVAQPGYYIYYEKNIEMQNYMVEHKHVKQEELIVDDRAIKEIRNKLQERNPQSITVIGDKDQKSVLRLAYTAGALLMVVTLVVVVSLMNNSEKMKDLEQALSTISNRLSVQNTENKDGEENKNIFDTEDETVPVSNVDRVTSIPYKTDKEENSLLTPEANNIDNPEEKDTDDISKNVNSTDGADEQSTGMNEGQESDQFKNTTPEDVQSSDNINKKPEDSSVNDSSKNDESNKDIEQIDSTKAVDNQKPASQTQESTGIDPTKLKKYTVKSGDTIAGICMRLYGDYNKMQTIKELNQLVDENKIFEGQVLLVP